MQEWLKSKKFTWKSVVFFIALVGVFMFLQSRMEKPLLDSKLMQAANEINRAAPIMVDSVTRFDNAVALTNNKIQFNYTLISADKENIDTAAFKEQMAPLIVNFIKTDPKAKLFKENETAFIFHYRDKNGIYLFSINVSADKYNN